MRLLVVAVGTRMPRWVNEGFEQYARRMPAHCRIELNEVSPARRTRGADPQRCLAEEGERMLRAVPRGARTVALTRQGTGRDSRSLARALEQWLGEGRDVALLIGGADGLAPAVVDAADEQWSLSALTLAHPVARLVLAEQLYRAASLLAGHPYHREAPPR